MMASLHYAALNGHLDIAKLCLQVPTTTSQKCAAVPRLVGREVVSGSQHWVSDTHKHTLSLYISLSGTHTLSLSLSISI